MAGQSLQFAGIAHGRCSRLDELQAAILTVKLAQLDAQTERRRTLAQAYAAGFSDLPLTLPIERTDCRHVYHLYVIRTERRDVLAHHLDHAGITTGLHYPYPVHVQPGIAIGVRIPDALTVTDAIVPQILTLPLFPSMSNDQQARVIAAVRSFFDKS